MATGPWRQRVHAAAIPSLGDQIAGPFCLVAAASDHARCLPQRLSCQAHRRRCASTLAYHPLEIAIYFEAAGKRSPDPSKLRGGRALLGSWVAVGQQSACQPSVRGMPCFGPAPAYASLSAGVGVGGAYNAARAGYRLGSTAVASDPNCFDRCLLSLAGVGGCGAEPHRGTDQRGHGPVSGRCRNPERKRADRSRDPRWGRSRPGRRLGRRVFRTRHVYDRQIARLRS